MHEYFGGMVKYTCPELDAMTTRQLKRVYRGLPPGKPHWWSRTVGKETETRDQ